MGGKVAGNLVIIGGAEDKENECTILKAFINLAGGKDAAIVIMTTAAALPEETGARYQDVFGRLGCQSVTVCHVQSRAEAHDPSSCEKIALSTGVFFTGGDQLRITSILGGTPLEEVLFRKYRAGIVVAGTSAGASAMSDLMIVEGQDDETPKKCTLKMAPGLGLLREVVIDQHFAQRGRIGRLMLAVSQNPYVLGIGIDEDTAIWIQPEGLLKVIGSQTATIVDGRPMIHTNISELRPNDSLAVIGAALHILPAGYGYDLAGRNVIFPEPEEGGHFAYRRNAHDYGSQLLQS
ncbi:MAG: cyanophycinase [Bacillota bacterium]|jgi:cyanophycinase